MSLVNEKIYILKYTPVCNLFIYVNFNCISVPNVLFMSLWKLMGNLTYPNLMYMNRTPSLMTRYKVISKYIAL